MSTVGDWFTQFELSDKHPVYNSLGRQIGYYTDLATLATGHIMLNAGEVAPPSDQLMVNCGFLATRKNAGDCLLSQGYAPVWASPQAVADAQVQNQPLSFSDLLPSLNISPSAFTADTPAVSGTQLGTIALWAGLGLVSLLVVKKALS